MQFDGLADANILELHFFEVGVDVHVLHRHYGQQRHARLHALTKLNLALGNDAIDGGDDDGALKVHGRLVATSACQRNFRVGVLGGIGDEYGIGFTRTEGRAAVCLGLRSGGARSNQVGFGGGKTVLRTGQFISRYGARCQQCLSAGEVDFCPLKICFGRAELSGRSLLVGITRSDLRA